MAALALGVVAWGENRYDLVVATTMGLTTLSLMHIAAALEAREPTGTIFSRYTIANRRFVQLIGGRARADLPRDRPVAAPADLRHGLADELAVGNLPSRPASSSWRFAELGKLFDRRRFAGMPSPVSA